mmetsp:Transcript_66467/g.185256  ORF Transcript_66467/g.185256 Transcript_66467/m.185256 type:complete len:257 (+) Transcript_66467:565-1335(+)
MRRSELPMTCKIGTLYVAGRTQTVLVTTRPPLRLLDCAPLSGTAPRRPPAFSHFSSLPLSKLSWRPWLTVAQTVSRSTSSSGAAWPSPCGSVPSPSPPRIRSNEPSFNADSNTSIILTLTASTSRLSSPCARIRSSDPSARESSKTCFIRSRTSSIVSAGASSSSAFTASWLERSSSSLPLSKASSISVRISVRSASTSSVARSTEHSACRLLQVSFKTSWRLPFSRAPSNMPSTLCLSVSAASLVSAPCACGVSS